MVKTISSPFVGAGVLWVIRLVGTAGGAGVLWVTRMVGADGRVTRCVMAVWGCCRGLDGGVGRITWTVQMCRTRIQRMAASGPLASAIRSCGLKMRNACETCVEWNSFGSCRHVKTAVW